MADSALVITNGEKIYRYLNFDQIEKFSEITDQITA